MADFKDVDVRKPCGLSAKVLQSRITPKLAGNEVTYKIPKGGSKMHNIAELMLQMEMEFGVSATFLCALMAWETGWGCNNYAYNYNSFFSYMAYDHNPDGTIANGGKTVAEGLRNGVRAVVGDFVVNKKCYTPRLFKDKGHYATGAGWLDGVSSVWATLQGSDPVGATPAEAGTGSGGRADVQWNPLVGRQWEWALYSIEKGDSISTLATMFKQTTAWMNKWNGIKSDTTLSPGQYVRVYAYYQAIDGDTLSEIAKDFGTTTDELHKLNPYMDKVYAKLKIRLPNSVIDDNPPSSYEQINRENPSAADRWSVELPLQPVVGQPPHVEDDEYPAHRTLQNPFAVRIGDVQLFIPPTSIKTHKDGFVDTKQTLRTQNGMMTRSGHTKRIIELELYFTDTDQINGYQVKGPQGANYYMDGLRPLIAQFMKNPFLPIRNELLNERHKVYNVAFQDLTIETHEDFDNVLVATLKLIECTIEPFIQYPDYYYDNLFMYPLFRWWYQQMLADKEANRLSARHLAPIPNGSLRNDIKFQVLDRDLVEDFVSASNMFKLSKTKLPELSSLMSEWDIGGAVLQRVTLGISKDLRPIYTDHHEMPCFQDLGGLNREFLLEFVCTNRAQLESLGNMVSHLEEMSRDFRQKFVSGFLSVSNDLINMIGVYNAMVINIETETISEHDEEYIVRLFCRAFDATQKNNERVGGVNSVLQDIDSFFSFSHGTSQLMEDKTHRSNGVMLEVAIEEALNTLELYPDLELPTYDDLNIAIQAINKYRRQYGRQVLPLSNIQRPPEAVFVDPDFYFAYPDIKRAFDELQTGQFGQQVVNLLDGMNTTADYVMATNEMDLGWWLDGIDADLENGWKSDPFVETQKKKSTTPVNLSTAIQDHVIPIGDYWNGKNPVPEGQEMLELMSHDMKLYNKRGRMVRAFPSYLIMFIDEGQWQNGKRLWNNYYTYHAIQEISVVKDKSQPVDLAYLRMTNIYGSFDFSTRMSDPRDFMPKSTGVFARAKKLFTNLFATIDEQTITERTQMIDQIKLKQGARVHIRMGYGATASYMPVCFNGQVATINEGDEMELVCQGDGVELTRIISTEVDGTCLDGNDLANEAQNVFRQILCTRQSDYWFAVSEDLSINRNYTSVYGIEHFGYLESLASDGGWGTFVDLASFTAEKITGLTGLTRNEYDLMKNIYRGTKWKAYTDDFYVFDQELNIDVNPFNRTTWDVMNVIALHTPEFITGVHPHGFRSTLFHGMPHWPVKYGYRRKKDANGKPTGKEGDFSSYVELYKTYQQFHVFASGADIVHNGIEVSSELIKHIAVGMYTKSRGADTTTTFPVYADRTIKQETQKTMLIDTMVHQNLPGFEWMYDLGRSTLGWIPDLLGWAAKIGSKIGINLGADLYEYMHPDELTSEQIAAFKKTYTAETIGQISETFDKNRMFQPGFEQALAITIGSLQRQMMEMYQGELICLGDPAVKPWDTFFLSDSYNLMNGTATVGKVTHTLGFSTGFMTIIKPDLCVTRVDGVQRNDLFAMLQRAGVLAAGLIVRRVAMTRAARMIAKVTGGATLWGAKAVGKGGLWATKLTLGESTVRLASQAISKGGSIIKGVTGLADFGSLGTKALKLVKTNFVTSILLGWIAQHFEDVERKELQFNNVLFIYPLWKANKPYVAGISGARYIIPGYLDPEWNPIEDIKKIDISDPSNVNPNREQKVTVSAGTPSVPFKSEYEGGLAAGSVVPPCEDMRITSPFGWRSSSGTFHRGIDIGPLERGKFTTPVFSIADGKIVDYGKNHSAMGNWITCTYKINGKDIVATYMHLHSLFIGFDIDARGMEILAGDKLGIMGNTGRIYKVKPGDIDAKGRAAGEGMHLHFELEYGTQRHTNTQEHLIDPEKWLRENNFAYTGGKLKK